MAYQHDDFGLGESDSDLSEESVSGTPTTNTEIAQLRQELKELTHAMEQARIQADKGEDRVEQMMQMAKSAKAVVLKNHRNEVKRLTNAIEDHKSTLAEDDTEIIQMKKQHLRLCTKGISDDQLSICLTDFKKSRSATRDGIKLKYKVKDMELLVATFTETKADTQQEVDRLKVRLSGAAAKSTTTRLVTLEKDRARFEDAIKARTMEQAQLRKNILRLEASTQAAQASRGGGVVVDPVLLALQQELEAAQGDGEVRTRAAEEAAEACDRLQGLVDAAHLQLQAAVEGVAAANDATAGGQAAGKAKLKGEESEKDAVLRGLAETKTKHAADLNKIQKSMKDREKQLGELKDKAKDKLQQASTTIKKLQTECSKLQAAMHKEKANAEVATGKQDALQQQLRALTTSNSAQRSALASLAKGLKAIQASVEGMRTDMQQAGDVIPAALPVFQKALADWKIANSAGSEQLVKNYLFEVTQRRYYFNRIQELKGNIRVYCRVRPINSAEEKQRLPTVVTFPSEGAMVVHQPAKNASHDFEFEKTFNPKSRQDDVFSEVSDLITSVLDGYNVCIFAYGQTGSGKTFTMEGPKENPGVNYRSLVTLFEKVEAKKADFRLDVHVSLLEIYNENILDLLGKDHTPLKCASSKKGGTEVAGLTKVSVNSTEEVLAWLKKGAKNRHVAHTSMNAASSRSHLVLTVYVEGDNLITKSHLRGKLNLIDLAGSERVGRSNVTGDQLKEAQKINYSLSALGNCIQARAQKKGHVPYRDSALTRLLQDSLEKNSKTLMIVQIAPCEKDVNESLCSLKFAARVRMVELGKATKGN